MYFQYLANTSKLMKYAVLIGFLLAVTFSHAQSKEKNYRIHVGSQPIFIQQDLKRNAEAFFANPDVYFNGNSFALLQFNDIPTIAEKKKMKDAGIVLLRYIPNYSWVTKLSSNVDESLLQKFNVRHIIPVSTEWKTSAELKNEIVPFHAGSNQNASVNVLFWTNAENSNFETILSEFDCSVQTVERNRGKVKIIASVDVLKEMAKHPLVQYIEFVEPPIENDGIKEESERIISPYISHNPAKGYYFNGAGARIAVDEGGIFDTLENPNLRSRIVRTFEVGTGVGGHKTSVGIRMAKAGNIDPREQGTAFGADLYSGGISTAIAAANNISIVNRSYGWGCPGGSETYASSSAGYDYDVRTNPKFIITHSAGNAGSSNCYVGSAGWGNITGMAKMAKNIFNVGSSGGDGTLTGFSSRGPAKDGRILPHIVAPGPGGTSHASPNLAGIFGQLNHAYRFHYASIPDAGLLKAIIMNTADDMENPGPDFRTGFGHVNARRGYEVIRAGNFQTSSVTQGTTNQHTISVPANVKKLKVMVYWVDWEATAGISTRTLVNDLDVVLEDPMTNTYQPWVLNPTFDPVLLDLPAVRATDSLNNHEQVTIDNPMAGTYQLSVSGTMVPQGPQEYYLTYEFITDDIVVTFPHGAEKFVPGETERIRWDACDSNLTFNISYSNDGGGSWSSISSGVNADSRFYDWIVPQDLTNQAMIRVERGGTLGQSDTTFSISALPENLELIWSCADSSLFHWDEFPNADGYTVYRIMGDYMDSVAHTTTNSIVLNGLSLTETEYVSIAVVQNGVTSRRVIAVEREPTDLNCNSNDVGVLEVLSPANQNIPDCMTGASGAVKIRVRNWGVNSVDSIPVAYQVNGGTIYWDTVYGNVSTGGSHDLTFGNALNLTVGNNVIQVWTAYSGDGIFTNDTLITNVSVYSSTNVTLDVVQSFDNFTNCSTSWDCELVNCAMQEGWYNIPNGSGDDIDWRTHDGATGSSGTGPSADHTSGSGKYLYLEGSGPCTNSEARLHSPCIDLTGVDYPQLSFWYHAYGGSIGELHVDVLADGELFEDVMTPIDGEQGNLWIEEVVDLSAFSGQQVVVIMRGSTGGGFYSDLAIDDINITSLVANDLAGSDFISGSCGVGLQPIIVEFQNVGAHALVVGDTIVFNYDDGTTSMIDTVVLTSDLPSQDFMTHTFSGLIDHTFNQPINMQVWSSWSQDADLSNDTIATVIIPVPSISSYPYFENFEQGQGGWIENNTNNGSWAFGTPNKTVIQGAASGGNAWVSGGLTGDYSANDDSWVEGPCFDFTTLTDTNAYISAKVWWNSEFSWDGANWTYSLDDGATWDLIGNFNDPNNWYNDNSINADPGGYDEGWTGRNSSGNGSDGWLQTKHKLPQEVLGQPNVKLRMNFSSDGSVQDDGFAWDDISIGVPDSIDANIVDFAGCAPYEIDYGKPGFYEYYAQDVSTMAITTLGFNYDGYWEFTNTSGADTSFNLIVNYVDASGCFPDTDTILITLSPAPIVDLSDTSICWDGTAVFSVNSAPYYTYSWNSGGTNAIDSVTVSGQVSVTVTHTGSGCATSDTAIVSQVAAVDLPTTSHVCTGDSIQLDAGSGYSSYLWSSLQSVQSINVNAAGTYIVTTTDSIGCISSDSTMVTESLPMPSITASDDSICVTASVNLDAGLGFASYAWSSGGTSQNETINGAALNTGNNTILVTVMDVDGCSNTDEVVVFVDDCASIAELEGNQLTVYPNPSTGVFTYSFEVPVDEVKMVLLDMTGKLVRNIDHVSGHGIIDLTELDSGVYTLMVELNDSTYGVRLIKQ